MSSYFGFDNFEESTALNLGSFSPKNQSNDLLKMSLAVTSIASSNPVTLHTSEHEERSYSIKLNDEQRFHAAVREIPKESWRIPSFIRDNLSKFSLTEAHRFEIAKICCKQEPASVGLLDNFHLSPESRKEVALLAIDLDFSALSQLPPDLRPCSTALLGAEESSDWELTTPPEISSQIKLFSQKMNVALRESGNHPHEELSLSMAIGAVDYWRLSLSSEQFAWVSKQGFFQTIFDLEAPHIRLPLIKSVKEAAERMSNFDNFIISDRIPRANLLQFPVIHLLTEDSERRTPLLTTLQGSARQLRDTKTFALVWKTLNLLSVDTTLSTAQKTKVIEAICSGPEPFIRQITSACIVLESNQTSLFKKDTLPALSQLALQAFQAIVPTSEPLDLSRFTEVFCHYRQSDAMMLYASDLSTLGNPQIMKSLGKHISSVLNDTYRQERYSTDENSHLQKIHAEYPELISKWSRNSEVVTLSSIFPSLQEMDIRSWIIKAVVDENQCDGLSCPRFEKCLQGDEKALESLKTELQKKGQDKELHARLALQNKLIQLAKSSNPENSQRLINELLQNTLISNDSEFRKNLVIKLKELSREVLLNSYTICETDSAEDLFLYGTESHDSCQAVGGNPEHSQGLLGSLHHGQTRLIAIKDREGRIIARSILRLLTDGDRPVVFLEQIYSNQKDNAYFSPAIHEMAKKSADRVSSPLAISDEGSGPFAKNLRSDGGSAEEEYVDAANGLCAKGYFTIRQVKLIYTPSLLIVAKPQHEEKSASVSSFVDSFDENIFGEEVNPYEMPVGESFKSNVEKKPEVYMSGDLDFLTDETNPYEMSSKEPLLAYEKKPSPPEKQASPVLNMFEWENEWLNEMNPY